MPPAIDITGLKKDHAGEQALKDLDLKIPAGSMYGVIGADGAGKSTLMKLLATLVPADAGSAAVLGFDIGRDRDAIRAAVGYMPQRFSLYEDLTVRENLFFFADIFGVPGRERRERYQRLLEFSRLGPAEHRRARHLSGGMKQKLALSCALIHTPRLLLLDEPTTGVDPVSRKEFWTLLCELHRSGITILVSTPYMEEAEYCDEIALLHQGRLLLQGAPATLPSGMDIFRLRLPGGIISWPGSRPPPPGISLLYPSGGELHAIATDSHIGLEEIQAALAPHFPAEIQVERAPARLEDLFFLLLHENQAEAPVQAPAQTPAKAEKA